MPLPLKEFSVPAALLLIALLTWLFLIGRLNGPSFVAGFGVIILAGVIGAVLLARYQDVSELHAKGGGAELLVRMEKVRDDVYAKVDSLRRLAEYLGRLAAFNVTTAGRLFGDDLNAVMLRERDELAAMLREVGVADDRLAEIVSKITERITQDLAIEVWRAVPQEIFTTGRAKGKDTKVVRQQLTDQLLGSAVGRAEEAGRQYLGPLEAWTPNVVGAVKRFDEFRRTGRLSPRADKTALGVLG